MTGDKISHYKIPKYIYLTDSYPLTATGKVKKREIRRIVNEL